MELFEKIISFLSNPAIIFLVFIFIVRKKMKKAGSWESFIKLMMQSSTNDWKNLKKLSPESGGDEPTGKPAENLLLGPALLQQPKIKMAGEKVVLNRKTKYLHVALNSTLEEAEEIIYQLPASHRILIEAGTPLIKTYGTRAISRIKSMAPSGTYIVADNKCADLASREVEMMANAGANASTCLGVAPIETIDRFIEECEKFSIDSMIDMMNVSDSLAVLKKLKKLPKVVILHRGVDESEFSKEKQLPYYQIKQIKGNYNILVAVAGGDTIKEVQSAIFNGADIVVIWKSVYQASENTANLVKKFLKEVK